MSREAADLGPRLKHELYHRLRPMTGRDPGEKGRSTTPLELLYDLTYVVAFGAAADQLAHGIGDGYVGAALGAYAFAIFAVTWAWINFTWFSSAYDNDDALFRGATLVQMLGVVILIFGLPVSLDATAEGGSPNNLLLVVGYVVMRVPIIGLWLRAAARTRRTAGSQSRTRSPSPSRRSGGCCPRSSRCRSASSSPRSCCWPWPRWSCRW